MLMAVGICHRVDTKALDSRFRGSDGGGMYELRRGYSANYGGGLGMVRWCFDYLAGMAVGGYVNDSRKGFANGGESIMLMMVTIYLRVGTKALDSRFRGNDDEGAMLMAVGVLC